jgi:hypothetical protein
MKRRITEPEKKFVAARQKWRCSSCDELLASTYQVDHTVALMNGGRDHTSNMTAMCVACHAKKTQDEHIDRTYAAITDTPVDFYDEAREDVVVSGGRMVRCTTCGHKRRATIEWHMHNCPGPGVGAALKRELAQYYFTSL